MAYLKIKNRAFSTLAADIISTATSLSVAAGEGAKFPSAGDFHITIEDEILKCTAITTDTLTVTRAQEGTTAAAHAAGKSVELRITAAVLESRTTWTADKLLKGAGAGVDPTEEEMNQSCRAEHSAAQSIPNGAWATLSFSSEAWDTNNIHDNATNNSRLTCKVAGYYLVIGFCQWVSNSTGRRLIRIQKNGTTTMFQAEPTISADNTYAPMAITGFLYLAVNDYIELQVFQTSGAALDTLYNAGDIPTNFNMHRLVT